MTNDSQQNPSDMQQVLGREQGRPGQRWFKVVITAVVLGLAGAGYFYFTSNGSTELRYKTAKVTKGDLTVKVTATGVLEPVNQVEVGTEISGTVRAVMVDFNDRVKKGEVLARLDTDQLRARLRQSQAALALANAKVKEAEATVIETRNKLKRATELDKKRLSTQEESDAAEAAYARAQAALASTQAQVVQSKAQLDSDRTAVDKAEIRSPIDGIVLKRQIEPGQTVAASLQTPVLFVLAENLAQMELHVAVDEADVGQVKEGQLASFSVDAYPNRNFPAKITQVRFAPQTVEGVVTYETVLSLDNSELLLRPGMTATADITVQQLHNVLLVPNAALRFRPPANSETQNSQRSGGLVSSLFSRHPRSSSSDKRKEMTPTSGSRQQVWTLRDGKPVAIAVQTGESNGRLTEVLKGEVEPGMSLLIDVESTGK